ncbi:MAG: class I SAM-dependent methyltransferase [bacterium]|nr:class I SAM-dependent methyltransferase [bacterium]
MDNILTQVNPLAGKPIGTGGFLDPQKVVMSFGIREGMRVADFGSGAGYFTILAAKIVGQGGRIIAIDIMDDALATLRAKASAEGITNIDTVKSNLEVPGSSGINNSSQDMVLAVNVLFQSEEKISIIKEAHRVLKDNGRMILIDWQKGTGGFGPPDDLRLNSEAMKSLAVEAGFELEAVIDAGVFHYGFVFKKT